MPNGTTGPGNVLPAPPPVPKSGAPGCVPLKGLTRSAGSGAAVRAAVVAGMAPKASTMATVMMTAAVPRRTPRYWHRLVPRVFRPTRDGATVPGVQLDWGLGRYESIGEQLLPAAEVAVARADVQPG